MSETPPAAPPPAPALRRELGVFGATMLGLGSIVGTGVFVSIGVAADAAGPAVVLAVALAAAVAVCNALSSAQLAASHPVSGGTYEYGYRYLRPWLGFAAGWMFLCAKSASAATAALGFAGYLLRLSGGGERWVVPLAVAAAAGVTLLVLGGIRRSSAVNVAVVGVTLLALAAFVVVGLPTLVARANQTMTPFFAPAAGRGAFGGLAEATALMFVAYTGYGRIATLGEEVREPRRTIPRAIVLTLIVSAILYGAVALVAVGSAGAAALRGPAPLEAAASTFRLPGVGVAVAVGAMTAMLGVLLNLVLGLSRVLLAMGRRRDMPAATADVRVATVAVGVAVAALACVGSVKATWSFSAFTVLVYYALTNAAALRLPRADRLYPAAVSWLGLAACGSLAFAVDARAWGAGLLLLAVGLAWHAAARRGRGEVA